MGPFARALTLTGAGLALLWPATGLAGTSDFDRERLDVFGFELFDLGVTDFDGDDDLDLFTTNHLARQSLLANDGTGQFSDRLYESRLAQTPRIPGWDDAGRAREDGPGLYVSHVRGKLVLTHLGQRPARGSVEFLFPVDSSARGRATARVRRDRSGRRDHYVARFEMHGDSGLRLDPERMAAPIRVRVARPFPRSQIVVGALETTPPRRSFLLYRRDRHGMAWGDFGGDRRSDVLIVRGGLRGQIKHIVGAIQDELAIADGSRFNDASVSSGLRKGDCRGRSAGTVDFDRDGRLDLYATCKKQPPKLYRQRSRGTFANASGALARGGIDPWVMRWIDLDGRPGEEVVGAYPHRFEVFAREGGRRQRTQSLRGRHGPVKGTLPVIGDLEGDGDADLYVAAASGSTLLVNREGRLRPLRPSALGLPNRALAAGWTDYDNDGALDLHVSPSGIFRQVAPREFERTGLLRTPQDAAEARLAWPDLDADGARDAIVAFRPSSSPQRFRTDMHLNQEAANHWLQVDLIGTRGNRQAIGARVRAVTGGVRQTQWVGQNETSLYSQGHYRLYFGLGSETAADLTVRWPDGEKREIAAVPAGQRLEVRRADG